MKDDALRAALVPDLVAPRVVEEERFAVAPRVGGVADGQARARRAVGALRHDESEVQLELRVRDAVVRRDPRRGLDGAEAGAEDGSDVERAEGAEERAGDGGRRGVAAARVALRRRVPRARQLEARPRPAARVVTVDSVE